MSAPAAEGPVARFAAALAEMEAELPWAALGAVYCDGPAEDFFDEERRALLLDTGLRVATELDRALRLVGGSLGASLYLGPGVAELAPMLFEALVLGRRVRAHALPGPEPEAWNAAARRVGERLGLALPAIESEPLERGGAQSVDHVWVASVLTDPDAFPALHDALYERAGTPLATARGDLASERARADVLVAALLDALRAPGVLSTTDEELELLAPACAARGLRLEVPREGLATALVGDRLRHCRVC